MAENKEINNLHGEFKADFPAMEAAVEDFVIIENVAPAGMQLQL